MLCLELYGDLSKRMLGNFIRLQGEEYKDTEAIKAPDYEWPGDFEGRLILGLTLSAQSLGIEPLYLDSIVKKYLRKKNKKGYFGPVQQENIVDEQQLSGHSWLLRGLIAYYCWKKEAFVLETIQNIVEGYLLPLTGKFKDYAMDSNEREYQEAAIGMASRNMIRGWKLSSDIGCAFIMLDGLAHTYELLRDERLRPLLNEMIDYYFRLDPINLSLQTHATLSALRGIVTYIKVTGARELLPKVQCWYSVYLENALTSNFENYNWFGRPSWTEPCAVIDSFILALELWKLTKNPKYLNNAHQIYYNAICYSQRENGGFGCDQCVGADGIFLVPKEGLYEAYWCCTMRGAEGLFMASDHLMEADKQGFSFLSYEDGIYTSSFGSEVIKLRVSTEYPYNGKVSLHVEYSNSDQRKTIKFFVPDSMKVHSLLKNGECLSYRMENGFAITETTMSIGDEIEMLLQIELYHVEEKSVVGYNKFFHGVLLLGAQSDAEIFLPEKRILTYLNYGVYQISNLSVQLRPLCLYKSGCSKSEKLQILFKGIFK